MGIFLFAAVSALFLNYPRYEDSSLLLWDIVLMDIKFEAFRSHCAFIFRPKLSKINLIGLFDPVEKDTIILQNAWNFSHTDAGLHPRRLESSAALL
jgi:hypothetical protein